MKMGDQLNTQTLKGVRVIDLTHLWAGPLCTRLLSELGAEVIKVEAPKRPDGLRTWQPPDDQRTIPTFDQLNHGKLSLALDLGKTAAIPLLTELIATADLVVFNYSTRVLRNWGLDPGSIVEAQPGLVWISMPAFSSQGPYRNFTGRGAGVQSIAGLADFNESTPRLFAAPMLDALAGLHACATAISAINYAKRTKKSLHIELPQSEVGLQVLGVLMASPNHDGQSWGASVQTLALGQLKYVARAPRLGHHTRTILRGIGLADSEVDQLMRDQIVECWPRELET